MDDDKAKPRAYWVRVSIISFRQSFQEVFRSGWGLAVEIGCRVIAWSILIREGLPNIAREHALWEIAFFVAALAGIFPLVFLVKLVLTPAKLDQEGAKRECDLREEIIRLQPKPSIIDTQKRGWVLAKVNRLSPDVRATLKRILLNGGGEYSKSGSTNAWGILRKEGLVTIDERYWCEIIPGMIEDLKAIFEEESRKQHQDQIDASNSSNSQT